MLIIFHVLTFSTKLKERQLLIHEFCLLCLSNSAATFNTVTEFKALNASAQLVTHFINNTMANTLTIFNSSKQFLNGVLAYDL